jgi:hypothetical protein
MPWFFYLGRWSSRARADRQYASVAGLSMETAYALMTQSVAAKSGVVVQATMKTS